MRTRDNMRILWTFLKLIQHLSNEAIKIVYSVWHLQLYYTDSDKVILKWIYHYFNSGYIQKLCWKSESSLTLNANCQATFSPHRRPRILTSLISGTEITYPIPLCVTEVLRARIHTSFTEIGHIFHNIDILKKKTSQVARLHPRRMELAYILSEWLRNPGKGNFRNLKSKKFSLGGTPRKIRKSVSIFLRSAPVFI